MTMNHAKRNAAQIYADRRADVNALIGRLCDELVKFDRRAAAQPKDWGFPGTLDYVRTTLIDLVEGLSGTDRAEIERGLSR